MDMEIKAPTPMSIPSLNKTSQIDRSSSANVNKNNVETEEQLKLADNKLNQEERELLSKEELSDQIDSMNKLFEMNNTSLHFNLHEKTDRYYVEIKDSNTQEVIKEIPTKEFLDLIGRIMDFAGLLIDKKV